MAVLDPNEIFYTALEPKQANRFILYVDGFPSYVIKKISGFNIENGEVTRGYVGISAEVNYKGIGVLVKGVQLNSPAYQGGVKKYDVIKKINNNTVTEIKEVQKIIGMLKPGQTLSMEIQRNRSLIKINILVSKMNYQAR